LFRRGALGPTSSHRDRRGYWIAGDKAARRAALQANPRSIDALFSPQTRYVVPMFQRLYTWGSSQWETLWEDVREKALMRLQGESGNAHYLGALIIEGVKPSSPREVMRFLVIDGQQRLTTLQLLLCAFRDYARDNGWRALDRKASRYLENQDADVMENPDEEVPKLWPTKLNREAFRGLIGAGSRAAVEILHPLVTPKWKKKPLPRVALAGAYLHFSDRIASWVETAAAAEGQDAEAAASALLQALQQDFAVVEISLSEGDDSQEIFYSLNSQGKPLSQSDLLRSLIFMRAEKERVDRDKLFEDHWERFETPFWNQEISRAGRTYTRLDIALRHFLSAKTGRLIDGRRVNEEYRRWVSAEPRPHATVQDELSDLGRHAAVFERYESADASTLPSVDMRRVLIDFDVSTALPLLMFLEVEAGLTQPDRAQCLAAIESFIARRGLCGEDNKEYNKLFPDIVASLLPLRGAAVYPALLAKLHSGGGSTRQWPSDEYMIERLISQPIYGTLRGPALRLALERLERFDRTKKSEAKDPPNGLQIEHVMPQAWAEFWPLSGVTIPAFVADYPHMAHGEFAELADAIRARNAAVQTIGNLTLLNQYLNPAAGKGSLGVKASEYEHSVLRLNRELKRLEAWDEAMIQARSRRMAEDLCVIWPRPAA
jgi:hypothetical protein